MKKIFSSTGKIVLPLLLAAAILWWMYRGFHWDDVKQALAINKPIIAYNCIYGTGVKVSPIPVFGWYISSTEIVLVGATLHVHIKSDNTCTILDVTAVG